MSDDGLENLDLVLEELTAEVLRLVEDSAFDERIRVETGAGWELRASLDSETFALDLVPESLEQVVALDDFGLAQLYGLGFDDAGERQAPFFRQEFDHDEDEEWEEQPVRELMLAVLGLLRDVLRCPPSGYRVVGERG